MPDRVTRQVEGHLIVTSGSLSCPHPNLCDGGPAVDDRAPEEYVRQHCREHNLGEFETRADAERNLGVWCFYYFDKYVWGNSELHPYPHWEIHAFIAESTWSETDLQHRIPLDRRKNKGYLPPAAERRVGEYRRFKQVEVPRQCQKTSIGARAYTIFRSIREYFVNGKKNYRFIIRSATGKNTKDTLEVIRRMSRKSPEIARLYGIWLMHCSHCGHNEQVPEKVLLCTKCNGDKVRHRRISLIDNTQGTGATGRDQMSFRWLTDSADAVAAYSVWVAGLKTTTTGQRPDHYTWDDPQTEENSRTVEMRRGISDRFDGSVRELQFGGELLVLDTRKYINDFCGKIADEPLASQFFSLRREVRWRTDEPDEAPWVVDGWRYYYPVRGDGQRALDAKQVAELRTQRTFSAEYMNNPVDEESQKFKRKDFIIVSKSDDPRDWPAHQTEAIPIEIRYGLGRGLTTAEQMELDSIRVRINAKNACDPAGDGTQKKTGDDNFIVATRQDRHSRIYIPKLAAGHWGSKRLYDEIESASTYNDAAFTDYEMPASETHIREAYDKWVRDRTEEQEAGGRLFERPNIKFEHMPKSGKDSRIDQMESFLPIYILDDAASPDLIEKYIMQWIARGIDDHDDGPDATSRLIKYFRGRKYKDPTEPEGDQWVDPNDGATYVTLAALKQMAVRKQPTGLWGAGGGDARGERCGNCGRFHGSYRCA